MSIVAMRTHRWSAEIAAMARRLSVAAAGCRFIVLADETDAVMETAPFEKLSHTQDFSRFGLPSFPPGQVLWYNADYPLYLLAQAFPEAGHYAMVEYDVAVNFALLPVFEAARAKQIDLIAHYIHPASPDWEWRAKVLAHLPEPLQAFLPFMVISGRAIDRLRLRRLALRRTDLREFEDWPFCEAFIPTVIGQLPGAAMEEVGRHASLAHYTLGRVLHPSDPAANIPGSLAHPVHAGGNIARGKPASQSSVHPWWNAASPEVDAARGNNGVLGGADGFNTAFEAAAWWQVDLLDDYEIGKIVVHDRVDGADRCGILRVSTSGDGVIWRELGEIDPNCGGGVFIDPPVSARYIRVTRLCEGELHLDEIEVFGKVVAISG